jgi:hypothetical protein
MTPRTLSRESVAAGRKGLLVVLPILLLTACTQNAAQPIAAPPTVRLTAVAPMESDTARFTGVVRARTESSLGFVSPARSSNVSSIPATVFMPVNR